MVFGGLQRAVERFCAAWDAAPARQAAARRGCSTHWGVGYRVEVCPIVRRWPQTSQQPPGWRWAAGRISAECGALVGGRYGAGGTSATPEIGKRIHIIRKRWLRSLQTIPRTLNTIPP
jgi:hypothetical protein